MKKLINNYKNTSKQTKIHLLLLILFCLIQVMVITKFQYIFGSNVDWMKQHIVFPDYFRNLFYQTGNLFPNFAPQLGAGQNIFYFAYYGLYNPIILFSYLLPFIPMSIYIMTISIISVIVSVILFYYFLRKNQFSNNTCFFISLLFLFSSSFLFHSHRHIMFVNYMPFLVLSLIGVWRYFVKHKSTVLIINICLMILTSYYYSIPGLIVICLYGLYYYLKQNQFISIKSLLREGFSFLLRVFTGILLSSILLLPLIYVIVNGRTSVSNSFDFSLLKPSIDLGYLMYGTYGVGLTAILWISLIYNILYLPKQYRTISILVGIIIVFPLFNYFLNGGLYLNGKVLIPFLPLFLFLIASMIKDIRTHKIDWKWLVLATLITALFFINAGGKKVYFFLDMIVTFFLLHGYQKKRKYILLVPVVMIGAVISTINHNQDDFVTIEKYQTQNSYYAYDVLNYINHNTESIYRYQDDLSGANGINYSYGKLDYRTTLYSSTSNLNYWNSFYNTFNNNDIYRNHFMLAQTNNLFFQRFMGIRYLLTNSQAPYGYHPVQEYQNGTLYENITVYPIGFTSTHLFSQTEFDKLSYIEKLLAYQNNIIVDHDSKNAILNTEYSSLDLEYALKEKENIEIEKTESSYLITSKNNGRLVLELDEPFKEETIIIRFQMNDIPSCKNGDTSITINGIMNKLTCRSWKYYNGNETFDYVLSTNDEIKELEIKFAKGNYDISDIGIYQVSNSFFEEQDIIPLKIDYSKTKGDVLEGTIDQIEDGYFLFTIPYDSGFTLFVDGEKTEIEMVNDAFIGFPITKGHHTIKLEFKAPYANLGKVISLFGVGVTLSIILYEKKGLSRNK